MVGIRGDFPLVSIPARGCSSLKCSDVQVQVAGLASSLFLCISEDEELQGKNMTVFRDDPTGLDSGDMIGSGTARRTPLCEEEIETTF